MPTGLKTIYGFVREEQQGSFAFLKEDITERLLVECHNVTDDLFDLQTTLPAYGQASGNMPDGSTITFTLWVSTHPQAAYLTLISAPSVKRAEDGSAFWIIELEYKVDVSNLTTGDIRQRPDQKTTNPDLPASQREQIVFPWDRPAVWTSSTRLVKHSTYLKPNGNPIVHANGFPILTPVDVDMVHEVHTFTFNIPYVNFDYDRDISTFVNGYNKVQLWQKPQYAWKLTSANVNEQYETLNVPVTGNQFTAHYVSVTLTFEYNPETWDLIIIDKHTFQLVLVNGAPTHLPIPVNARGDFAQEPWPLLANGEAVPWNNNNPQNYAQLQTGWNPANSPQGDIKNMVLGYRLTIPGVAP